MKILKRQKKIYDTAIWDYKNLKFRLKLKQLNKLYHLVFDYAENNFYHETQQELQEITEVLTLGFIQQVLSELDNQW